MENILFTSLVGSQARGTATPSSDHDYVGAWVATRQELGGFDWKPSNETVTDASPEGDDHTHHEIRKWLKLAAKCNPSVVEPMFSDQISTSSWEGSEALEVSRSLLNAKAMRAASIGMMISQMKRYAGAKDRNPKLIQSALSIGTIAINLLRDGTTSIRIEDPRMHHEFPLMSDDDILSILKNKISEIENMPSVLPNEPSWDRAIEFLHYIRTIY